MADDSPVSVADVPKKDDQNDQSDQNDQNDQNGDDASEKTSVSSEPGSDHESNAEDAKEDAEAKEGSPSPSPASPEKPKIKKRKSSRRRKKSSSTSVSSRPRSRKSRSHSAKRPRPSTSNRHLIVCWYGRKCNRTECWFKHPDGRECDERKGKGGGGKGEPCNFRRRRSSSAHRRRERSGSRQRYRSPQKSRRRTVASRSASTKPTRPRRGRKSNVEKECKDTEGNPEGKQVEVQTKVKEKNPLKKVNFREFMMNHCEDGASPEDAIVAFKVYCEDLVKKELDILKNTGLFFDLYHPMAQLRFYDWQRQMAQIRSRNFAHDLNANKYHSLSLRARRPGLPGANVPMAPTCPVAGHLKAPEFAFDANVGALMISGLPVAVSTWDVVEAMQDFPGFITAAWTPPSSEKELSRTFYASFADAKAARAALFGLSEQADLLSNKGTAGVARASLLEASVDLSALVLPPEMSSPERLKKDVELSAKVIRKMDDHFGISADVTTAVLSHQLDTERQLDIQILYLRRVHHFCFYSGKWCKDEWTLRDCCGAAALRETPSASGDGPSVWAVGHEKRIHDFLQQAMDKEIVGRPMVLHHQEPKVLERFQRAANEKILKVHDQKFQCQACNKFFKGPEYVFKHLHRIHTNILDGVREELHQEIARSAFLADPAHPPAYAMTS